VSSGKKDETHASEQKRGWGYQIAASPWKRRYSFGERNDKTGTGLVAVL